MKRALIVIGAIVVIVILVVGFQEVPASGQSGAEAKVRRALKKCPDPPAPQDALEKSVECTAEGNTWSCTYAGSKTLATFEQGASSAQVAQAVAC